MYVKLQAKLTTKKSKYLSNVTLHMTLKLKVIARSQHTHTTHLVCPEDTDMRIIIGKTKEDTLALFWKSLTR